MTIDPRENPSDSTEDSASNPYAPPTLDEQAVQIAALSRDVQAVPDPDFWVVSFLITGLFLVSTFVVSGFGLIALISFVMGILRVCFVYSRRARVGLQPLPYGNLLITSTFISFGILVSTVVTFFTACSMAIPFVNTPQFGVIALLLAGITALVVTIFLFICSFALSMKP